MLTKREKLDLAEIEEEVLAYWRERRVFEKSVSRRRGGKRFVFYEGPPYANGKPGVHHVLSRVYKDIILRYKAMRGYYVPRIAGWDTHGLPIELLAEKRLGIASKREIEKLGIASFNATARELVFENKDEWERMTERIGYWLDTKHAYQTLANGYIERLWGLFKEFSRRGHLVKDYKVVPWCPRCQTPLASHEVSQPGVYKIVPDPSVYIRFRLADDPKTSLLVWTTTPWTLPSNILIAAHPRQSYTKFRVGDEFVWSREAPPLPPGVRAEPVSRTTGAKLAGLAYTPLFASSSAGDSAYRVVSAEFVSETEGTGLVHIAPAFGEDDFALARSLSLREFPVSVDGEGRVLPPFPGAGKFIKEADADILADLSARGLLFHSATAEHEYPHCWRCSTPLIQFARSSWFLTMSTLRRELARANEGITWIPETIKTGRFGEWIREAKDWAISRERYWGTPLPIWECSSCSEFIVVGSLKEFAKLAGRSRNTYIAMRHGEAQSNVRGVVSSHPETFENTLTSRGKRQVRAAISRLKRERIDLIVSSDLARTEETARLVASALGVPHVTDARLREISCGSLNGRAVHEYETAAGESASRFAKAPAGGETLSEVRSRVMALVRELEATHEGRRILLVSHGDPLWILFGAAQGLSDEAIVSRRARSYPKLAVPTKLAYLPLPYDSEGRLDLHRPFVDEVRLSCPHCHGALTRTPGVADVWFDSGAMPFGAGFHPESFPADYICEGVDQTRGWFYTLLAISVLLGKGRPYKNVISLGLINDKYGQKMSKSRGNVIDPWSVIGAHGVDSLRWYFFTVSAPGDTKRFDEEELRQTTRRFFLIAFNVFSFYQLYARRHTRPGVARRSAHVLDRWILARLAEVTKSATSALEAYRIGDAARSLEGFLDDLSRWYLRRSRRRFQRPESQADLEAAAQTLHLVLSLFARLIAPFAPFFAEALHLSLGHRESVHLADWPKPPTRPQTRLIALMREARELVAQALALRAAAGIKVRQPLARLTVRAPGLARQPEILGLIAEEVNVKEVVHDARASDSVTLDTVITPELRAEGVRREFVRAVQDLRQDARLKPGDPVELFVIAPEALATLLRCAENEIRAAVSAERITFDSRGRGATALIETKIGEHSVTIAVKAL